jgi:ABC-type phosphate/phosphonate transport system substrate-binding protein
MVRLGGAASPTYISVFRGLQVHFRRHGIELDWVLYSDYDALVEAFVRREIDLAWNAPLAYVKIKRRLQDPCQVVAMRDVDVNFTTHFITHAGSGITTVQDLKGKRVALGSRGSMQAGLLPYYFLQQMGLDPAHDLAVCSFHDERQSNTHLDERDVVERVGRHEYDAGAVSRRTIEALQAEGLWRQMACGSYGPVRAIVTAVSQRKATWIRRWSRRLPRPLSRSMRRIPPARRF